jgi:hypothetical protein
MPALGESIIQGERDRLLYMHVPRALWKFTKMRFQDFSTHAHHQDAKSDNKPAVKNRLASIVNAAAEKKHKARSRTNKLVRAESSFADTDYTTADIIPFTEATTDNATNDTKPGPMSGTNPHKHLNSVAASNVNMDHVRLDLLQIVWGRVFIYTPLVIICLWLPSVYPLSTSVCLFPTCLTLIDR